MCWETRDKNRAGTKQQYRKKLQAKPSGSDLSAPAMWRGGSSIRVGVEKFLPPFFARRMGHLANQETEIEDYNGQRWSVTYSYVNGFLAFQKGWHKFVMDHDLKEGQLLVFKYIKGSHFVVHIFGTSADERKNFGNGGPPRKKRPRREKPEPLFHAIDVNSDTSFVSGSECRNCQGHVRRVPTCINMEEDLTCLINRDDGLYRGEDRNFLYDLSSFEMEIKTSDANKFEKPLDTKISPSHAERFENVSHTKVIPSHTEPRDKNKDALNTKIAFSNAEIMEHANKFEKFLDTEKEASHAENKERADKFEKALETNSAPSHTEAREHVDKIEKALETNIAPSHTEATEQTKSKEGDIEMPVIRTNQTNGNSDVIFADMAHAKPSEESSLSKDTSDDVSKFPNGNNHVQASDSETPSIGSSKIAEKEYAVIRRLRESSVSSKRNIKKELVESVEDANGKKLTTVRKWSEIIPPVVKVEPDLSYDSVGSVAVSPFSAEVKSLSYLELPVHIPSIPRSRNRGRGKVVYLRDPAGTLWPVLYPDIFCGRALTDNWRNFCEKNNIKLGDECRFQVEDSKLCIYSVDVNHRSD
ncbi:hypothetical protein BUALT_Bualt02G0085900 [Buddleja alternifolia]|uniref:TF-B3 domain-containing protein n=1 Tax=Buddleja alternifolia TaxID=168488 RepID=A0AAV6Y9D5_9LAMI|nr:hypothetical protein BUALT_Bualt02G0085900 [Buddleja alternifolia]